MPADKLSAKEAALIAQARAQVAKSQAPAAAQVARVKRTLESTAHSRPAPVETPAERLAALMDAARAENERERERQRRLYLWTPLAFISVVALWALLWMWRRL